MYSFGQFSSLLSFVNLLYGLCGRQSVFVYFEFVTSPCDHHHYDILSDWQTIILYSMYWDIWNIPQANDYNLIQW